MADKGMNSADLRERYRLEEMERSRGAPQTRDSIRDALQVRKEILAQEIMDETVSRKEATATQAEVEKLKAEVEKQELMAKLRAPVDEGSKVTDLLMEEVHELRDKLDATQKALTDSQLQSLSEKIQGLESYIQQVQVGNQSTDAIDDIRSKLVQAKSLMELLIPENGSPPPVPVEDPALKAWMRRVEIDHDKWKIQEELRHQERLEEIRLKDDAQKEEMRLKQNHYERLDRFIDVTLPNLIGRFTPLINRLAGGAEAKAAVAPVTPPGVKALTCESCGATVLYRDNYAGVICQQCGAEYEMNREETQPPPPSPGRNGSGGADVQANDTTE